jgi:hypothetical protein
MSLVENGFNQNRINSFQNSCIKEYLKKRLPVLYVIIYTILICILSLIQLSIQIVVLVKFDLLAIRNDPISIISNYVSNISIF